MKWAYLFVLVAAVGCGSSVVPDTDAGADGLPSQCCPIAENPTCDCFAIGGARDNRGECLSICDFHPGNAELVVDPASGCRVWREVQNGYSCFPPWDADAAVPDAQPVDAGDPDAAAAP